MATGNYFLFFQKVKNNRRTVSNPTSPVSNRPRRAVSTPEELALNQDAVDAGFLVPDDRSPNSSGDDGTYGRHRHYRQENPYATAPRAGQRGDFQDPKGLVANNTYDRRIIRGDLPHDHQHHQCNMGNSVHSGRRGDPHTIYQTRKEAVYQTRQEAIYQSRREAQYQTRQEALHQSRQEALRQQQQPQHRDPVYQTRQEAGSGGQAAIQNIYETIDHDRSNDKRRLSKPELRQFSREPTVLKLSDHAGRDDDDKIDYPINKIEDDLDHIQITVKEAYNKNGRDKDRELPSRNGGRKTPMSPPRKSQSSSSPEWPPPPDPITSPQTPNQTGAVPFDSSTLKRMLRGLPNNEQNNGNNNNGEQPDVTVKDQGFHETKEQPNVPHVPSSSSQTHGATYSSDSQKREPSSHLDLANGPPTDARPPMPNRRQRYTAGDAEYAQIYKTTGRTRDSCPDSGVSGMTNDSRSVRSGDSGRSRSSDGRSSKSITLPPGKSPYFICSIAIFWDVWKAYATRGS